MKMTRTLIALLLMLTLLCGMANAEDVVSVIINSRTTQAFTADAVPEEDLNAILEAGLAATSAINQQPWYFAVVTDAEVIDTIKSSAGGFGGAPKGDKPGAPAGNMPAGDKPEGAPAGDKPEAPAGNMPEGMPAMPKGAGGAKAGLGDSPVAIIIYMNEATASPNANFDCGLACENMFIAARALGYGVKIVSSPTMQLNGDDHDALCERLGVDPSYTAVAVLLIGAEDTSVDGYTSASVRSGIDEKVSFVK